MNQLEQAAREAIEVLRKCKTCSLDTNVRELLKKQVIELEAALAQQDKADMTNAARDVLIERQRQVQTEGWTPEHDDQHEFGELAMAAACYAGNAGGYVWDGGWPEIVWPWAREWWKPSTPRRDLVKAAALILAEIERLDRAQQEKPEPVEYQYQDRDGKWYFFSNEKHKIDTIADGTWPIRKLYAEPPRRKWVGLTDEQRESLFSSYLLSGFFSGSKCVAYRNGVNDADAKLKELNHGH